MGNERRQLTLAVHIIGSELQTSVKNVLDLVGIFRFPFLFLLFFIHPISVCPDSALSGCVSSQDDRPACFLAPWEYEGVSTP